ncbi:unnamed protein product, partial [Cyprideis torosa]
VSTTPAYDTKQLVSSEGGMRQGHEELSRGLVPAANHSFRRFAQSEEQRWQSSTASPIALDSSRPKTSGTSSWEMTTNDQPLLQVSRPCVVHAAVPGRSQGGDRADGLIGMGSGSDSATDYHLRSAFIVELPCRGVVFWTSSASGPTPSVFWDQCQPTEGLQFDARFTREPSAATFLPVGHYVHYPSEWSVDKQR